MYIEHFWRLTWITMAIHCMVDILLRSVVTMTKAVMKMTPDLVKAIVPGSASLYDTNICIKILISTSTLP
jgi:hypothetical protein